MIAQGLTKKQIKAELVARYGPSILATPEDHGFELAAYLVPIAAVLAALDGAGDRAAALAPPPARRGRRRGRRRRRAAGDERRRRPPAGRGPRALRRLSAEPRPPMPPLAAAQADTTVIAAFAVGFVSFVSPCVLPLVPGYLSAVSGVSIADMRSGEHKLSAILVAGRDLLPVVHDHVRRARHDRDRRSARRCATPSRRSTASPAS